MRFKISCLRYVYLTATLLLTVALFLPLKNNYFCVDDFYNLIIASETDSFRDFFKPVFQHMGPFLRLYFFALFKSFDLNYHFFFFCVLGIHLINSLLVYKLLGKIFSTTISVLLTPIYAWNPLFYEGINWQTNIGQMICILFILLTLNFLHKYRIDDDCKNLYLILSIIFSICSILSFSVGLLIPVFASFYYYLVIKKRIRFDLREDMATLIGYFFVPVSYIMYVMTRPGLSLGSFFALSPTLLKYIAATTFCVLLPALVGLGPFHIESPTLLLLYIFICLTFLSVITVPVRKQLNWKIISFAVLYLMVNYTLHGAARLHLFGYEITYWIRYQLFQPFAVVLIAAEYLRSVQLRFNIKNTNMFVLTIIIIEAIFYWNSIKYIQRQNTIYTERYRYGDVREYVNNIRESSGMLTSKNGYPEIIYLSRDETVPYYVMPDTLRPLNKQKRFLRLVIPPYNKIRIADVGSSKVAWAIDENGNVSMLTKY